MIEAPEKIEKAHQLADYYGATLKTRVLALKRLMSLDGPNSSFAVEQGFVHSRKIVELIAYFARLSHDVAGVPLSREVTKQYNANLIIKWLDRTTGLSFPTPIDVVPDDRGDADGRFIDASALRDCLNADFAKRVYVKSGEVLHQDQSPLGMAEWEARFEMLEQMTVKSANLLERFDMELPEANWMLIGQLHFDEPNRRPETFLAPQGTRPEGSRA